MLKEEDGSAAVSAPVFLFLYRKFHPDLKAAAILQAVKPAAMGFHNLRAGAKPDLAAFPPIGTGCHSIPEGHDQPVRLMRIRGCPEALLPLTGIMTFWMDVPLVIRFAE